MPREHRNTFNLLSGLTDRVGGMTRTIHMQTDLVRGIEHAYSERTNPIVFALTGRTGSGCTTAAASLSLPFNEISLSEEDFQPPERRKISITLEYARANWVPFTAITVSSVIYSYLLDEPLKELDAFLIERK